MLNILFGVFFTAAVANVAFFRGQVFWSVLTALLALGLLGFRLLFASRVKPSLLRPIALTGAVVLVAVGFWCGMRPVEGGYLAYGDEVARIERHLAQGESIQAGEALAGLRERYGATDAVLLMEARAAIGKKEYLKASDALNTLSDKRQEPYFATLGQIHMLQQQYDEALAVYVDGARTWPMWGEMQLQAGAQAVCVKNYPVAEYFLLRAAEQMPQNPVPLYYLGVARYEQGYPDEADVYFNEALELGLDRERAGYVAWYREQAEGGAK